MSDQQFLQAKAYLQQTDINGNSIYELLVDYINNAKDKNGLDFETIIQELVQDNFDKSYFDKKAIPVVVNENIVKDAESLRKLLRKGRRQRVQEPKPSVTNILEDMSYFGEGGIGISETDAFALQSSINLFVSTNKLRYARFFGLIYGLENNYYIIETEHTGEQSENDKRVTGQFSSQNVKVTLGGSEQPAEENKEGTNKFSYWVTTNPSEPWVQLPNVQPAQIVTARHFKKYFTGRLDAPVTSYPIFPGTEANLLRVQIGRISAATTIAPKGVFAIPEKEEDEREGPKKVVEEPVHDFVSKVDMKPKAEGDEEEEEEGEFEKLSAKALENLESWVHLYPHIMDTGRVTVYKPPKPARGDDEEDDDDEEEEGGPALIERLRGLNMDAGLEIPKFIRPKIVKKKKSGDDEEEEEEPEEEEEEEEGEGGIKKGQMAPWVVRTQNRSATSDSSCISIIKSLRWPGAYAYATANGKKNASVYIGSGFKETGGLNVFTPLLPPPFQQEMAKVPTQQVDPNVTMINRVYLGQGPPLDEDAEDDDE